MTAPRTASGNVVNLGTFNDREILTALDEMSPAVCDGIEATKTDLLAQMVDQAPAPHRSRGTANTE